jgi:hypothetical protein
MSNNIQAFPHRYTAAYGSEFPGEGMTLRDYFAGNIIGSVLSDLRNNRENLPENWKEGISVEAYEIADCMIKARGI